MQTNEIKKIAENIATAESGRRSLGEFVKKISPQFDLVKNVEPANLENIKIAGIDGGIVKTTLHGYDLILARAVGVCFNFKNGRIEKVDYFPSKFPPSKPFTLEASSEVDFMYFSSIVRQLLEIQRAIDCIEKFKPEILLLDGSIVPHYMSKPSKTSVVYTEYEKLLDLYKKLYEKIEESGTFLAGVVEDSRNDRFCKLLGKFILPKIENQSFSGLLERSRDTNLLFWVLDKNERTQTFSYSEDENLNQKELNKNVYSFYIKTAKYDRPVRVDFLDKEKEDFIASVLLSITGQHSGYGFPTVLIEADNVAKLSEQEIDNFYSFILKYTGNLPSIMRLRRDQRPF